jgi:flagellar motility protein MotE (MotC chaperone)
MAKDWKTTLEDRATHIRNELDALDDDIVLAHAAGMSWRDIGKAANMNHEKARQAAARIAKRAESPPEPAHRDSEEPHP